MKMKKRLLSIAVATTLTTVSQMSYAALPANAVLNATSGAAYVCNAGYGTPPDSCSFGTNVTSGSWFGMDGSGNGSIGNGEKVRIDAYDGIRIGILQPASGSHSGAPGCVPGVGTCADTVPSSESPDVDSWGFFGGTGMHQTTSVITIESDDGSGNVTLGFSGWNVTWNGIPSIPMGGDTANFGADTGIAALVCGVDCADGDTFTLDYAAHVPLGDVSGFGGVLYEAHIEGTVGVCSGDGSAPNAVNDSYDVATDTVTSLAIQANDVDVGCSGLDKGSIDLDPANPGQQTAITGLAGGGSATVDATTGVVSYAPGAGYIGLDSFSYTISDRATITSTTTTVDIVIGDVPPICNDDGLADGAFIDITKNTSVNIDVLANDLNVTNTIVPSTVVIVNNVSNGMPVFAEPDGTITYIPDSGFTGEDSFTYNVTDDGGTPLTCVDATVNILVTAAGDPIGGVQNAFLVLASGKVDDANTKPVLGAGSWFSMELSPGNFTYTPIVGLNHIQLGAEQSGLSPNMPNIDSPWNFFGNLGVHQTTGTLNQLSNAAGIATLDFTVWNVSWNAIPSIPMSDGPDNGVATVTCYEDLLAGTPGIGVQSCDTGDEFVLSYRATVPLGDASGFGGVNYTAYLEGTISASAPILGCGNGAASYDVDTTTVIGDCTTMPTLSLLPGSTATAAGNTSGLYMSASDVGSKDPLLNSNDGQQCVGGCLDFVIENVTTGEAHLVVNLTAPILDGSIYRKLYNGRWQDFDVSGDDSVGSAESIAVDSATGLPIAADVVFDPAIHEKRCQGPEGVFKIGLREGNECLYLKIIDGGPNDADGLVNGTITDPSGVLLSGSPNVPASATKGGCSISKTPVRLSERADWLIVAGFIVWLGLIGYRRNKTVN